MEVIKSAEVERVFFGRRLHLPTAEEEEDNSTMSGPNSPETSSHTGTSAPIRSSTARKEVNAMLLKLFWEKKFPNITYLVYQKSDWEALFKLLKLTEETVNNNKLYIKEFVKSEVAELQKAYKEWWVLARTAQSMNENVIRKMSKFLRTFILTAMEEPSHTIQVKPVTASARAAAKKRQKQVSTKSYSRSAQESRHQRSPYPSRVTMIPEAKSDTSSDLLHEMTTKSSKMGPLSASPLRQSKELSAMQSRLQASDTASMGLTAKSATTSAESALSLPTYPSGSMAELATAIPQDPDRSRDPAASILESSQTKLEEMYYMQVILKDILKDLTKFSDKQQEKLQVDRRVTRFQGYAGQPWPKFGLPRDIAYPSGTSLIREHIVLPKTSRIKKLRELTPGQKALNEVKRLSRGLWPMQRFGEPERKYPVAMQKSKTFYARKHLMLPQEKAKRVLKTKISLALSPLFQANDEF